MLWADIPAKAGIQARNPSFQRKLESVWIASRDWTDKSKMDPSFRWDDEGRRDDDRVLEA